jgi:ABC-2 type transport system ATP-binding protein
LTVTGLDCAAVGGAASAHGITLIELAAQVSTLEEAFFDLTRDETDYHAGQLTGSTKGN